MLCKAQALCLLKTTHKDSFKKHLFCSLVELAYSSVIPRPQNFAFTLFFREETWVGRSKTALLKQEDISPERRLQGMWQKCHLMGLALVGKVECSARNRNRSGHQRARQGMHGPGWRAYAGWEPEGWGVGGVAQGFPPAVPETSHWLWSQQWLPPMTQKKQRT